jgi:hypothetical protein
MAGLNNIDFFSKAGPVNARFPLFNSGSVDPVASVPGLIEGAEMTYFDNTCNLKALKVSN